MNKNSSRYPTTSLCQSRPLLLKAAFPSPEKCPNLSLSSAVPFSYPAFHSLQRERINDCGPFSLWTSIPDVQEAVMHKDTVNHPFTDAPGHAVQSSPLLSEHSEPFLRLAAEFCFHDSPVKSFLWFTLGWRDWSSGAEAEFCRFPRLAAKYPRLGSHTAFSFIVIMSVYQSLWDQEFF